MKSFASDYLCKPHPAVVQAIVNACSEAADGSYGQDSITEAAARHLSLQFGSASIYPFFVSNGTAANRLALQTVLTRPYESVLCSEYAHINTAEGGALESLGHKMITVPTTNGKIKVAVLDSFVRKQKDIHVAYPRVLSISNPTELGTIYHEDELEVIGNYAWSNNLILHIDGARLSNAAAAWNVDSLVPLISSTKGVVLTLGATKNGGMLGDAVIFFEHREAKVALRLQKQHGQLNARTHCIAAQVAALYSKNIWRENAANANRMAKLLAERCRALGFSEKYPVESNAVFVRLPHELIPKLRKKTPFYVWDEAEGIVRFMCSWEHTEDDVEELIQLIKDTMA